MEKFLNLSCEGESRQLFTEQINFISSSFNHLPSWVFSLSDFKEGTATIL